MVIMLCWNAFSAVLPVIFGAIPAYSMSGALHFTVRLCAPNQSFCDPPSCLSFSFSLVSVWLVRNVSVWFQFQFGFSFGFSFSFGLSEQSQAEQMCTSQCRHKQYKTGQNGTVATSTQLAVQGDQCMPILPLSWPKDKGKVLHA